MNNELCVNLIGEYYNDIYSLSLLFPKNLDKQMKNRRRELLTKFCNEHIRKVIVKIRVFNIGVFNIHKPSPKFGEIFRCTYPKYEDLYVPIWLTVALPPITLSPPIKLNLNSDNVINIGDTNNNMDKNNKDTNDIYRNKNNNRYRNKNKNANTNMFRHRNNANMFRHRNNNRYRNRNNNRYRNRNNTIINRYRNTYRHRNRN